MKIMVYGWLERFFDGLSKWAEKKRCRFAICPVCGRNRYSGQACQGGK
jgi:hypothetical protein